MLSSDIPAKFPVPWGVNAGAGYIRTIPIPSQELITPGAASLTDGFVPLNGTLVAAGGIPPDERDFNGILNWITLWDRWQNAGAPVFYDAAFSAAIGGYPKGAELTAAAGGFWWLSLVENNVTDPDTGGAGWQKVTPFVQLPFSLGVNGYRTNQDGSIDQWGQATIPASGTTSSGVVVVFPLTFPTACWNVQVTAAGGANSTYGYYPAANSTFMTQAGFDAGIDILGGDSGIVSINQPVLVNWRAIGN